MLSPRMTPAEGGCNDGVECLSFYRGKLLAINSKMETTDRSEKTEDRQ